MKKWCYLMILPMAIACSKEEKLYTQDEMQHVFDSSVAARQKLLEQKMADDLDQRSTIMVKPLADSIVQERSK